LGHRFAAQAQLPLLWALCVTQESKGILLRKVLFKITAGTVALAALFLCLLGPMYLFRVYHEIDLNAQGPGEEIWFLIVGGGIGAGLARFVHWWLYCSIGGYSEQQGNEALGRKY